MANRDDAKAVWNDKGCKKGMLAIEKNWADIGNGEPFTMAAIAMIFREQAGEPPEKLDLKEVGEFLAGGAQSSSRCHPARTRAAILSIRNLRCGRLLACGHHALAPVCCR